MLPTTSVQTLYDILGVDRSATAEEIKSAYRRAAKRCHPDTGGSAEAFEQVQIAWSVLGDPGRRARYDATGQYDAAPEPDNSLARVHSFIMGAVQRAMQGDVVHIDIIKRAASHLDQDHQSGKQANAALEANKDKLLKVLKRLKFKGSGVDLIARTLNDQIADIERNIASNSEMMDSVAEAARLLREGYAYEVDPRVDPWAATQTEFQRLIMEDIRRGY